MFELMLAARDVEAARIAEFVFTFTPLVTAAVPRASDDEAFVTSDCVANDPLESEDPVSVRVPLAHTSAASVPNVVSEREADDQTLKGIFTASEDEAFQTVVFVFELTDDIAADD